MGLGGVWKDNFEKFLEILAAVRGFSAGLCEVLVRCFGVP